MYKITYSSSAKYLVFTLAALLLAGCVHIPEQPQLNYSSEISSKQSITRCTADISLSQENAIARNGLSPERISVLNWNMYKQSHDNWAVDFQRLSHNQDILILQEAYMDDTLTSVLSESPYSWAMTTAFVHQDNANGVLTASRKQSNTHCALYAKEPFIQIPKSILVSTYPLVDTNQTLLVVNVHGINFTLGLESYRQQFDALGKVIQHHRGPIILAGDFNSWRKDRQAILDKLGQELSLQRVGYESHRRITVFGNPIDHIYYRGLEVIDASSPSVTSSDHNPLLVAFKVTEEQQKRYANTP